MIDSALLDRAVARGILTEIQARELADLARQPASASVPNDDEQLRLVTGFADIFVTIGLVLFLGTLAFFGASPFGFAVTAAAAWALAEFFTRRRRMALPSIVLLLAFVGAVGGSILLAYDPYARISGIRPVFLALAALGTTLFAALHYWRFAVPITIAAGTAALVAAALYGALAWKPEFVTDHWDAFLIAAGIGTFALAMRFDLADPLRITRRTDIAFWLHLLAAPLIVHPVLARLASSSGDVESGNAGLVLAVVLVLALVALVTDRRAILVSGLVYAGSAFGNLVQGTGITTDVLPLTLLALGAFILTLSAGWHPLRGLILRALPSRMAARLPHPVGAR